MSPGAVSDAADSAANATLDHAARRREDAHPAPPQHQQVLHRSAPASLLYQELSSRHQPAPAFISWLPSTERSFICRPLSNADGDDSAPAASGPGSDGVSGVQQSDPRHLFVRDPLPSTVDAGASTSSPATQPQVAGL